MILKSLTKGAAVLTIAAVGWVFLPMIYGVVIGILAGLGLVNGANALSVVPMLTVLGVFALVGWYVS